MKLIALEIAHESNSFAAGQTTFAAFEEAGILRGPDVMDAHRGARTTMGGFIAAGRRSRVEVQPLLYTFPTPSGPIARAAFDRLAAEAIDAIRRTLPADGILLGLHGAAIVDGLPAAEAVLVERVRALVGPSLPVGIACDLHANLGGRLVDASTVIVGYRTNPHLDAADRGLECAELVLRSSQDEQRPHTVLVKPPLIPNPLRQGTGDEPFRSILAIAAEIRERPAILSVSVAQGHVYGDVPEMGMGIVVHGRDRRSATDAAQDLALEIWQRRTDMVAVALGPDDAMRLGPSDRPGPIVLLDTGDNVGGGAPGTSTALLQAARRAGRRSVLATILDRDAVEHCHEVGVDGLVTMEIGEDPATPDGPGFRIEGRIERFIDGHFEDTGPTHTGARSFDAGPSAVVATSDGHTVLLTTRLVMPVSLSQYTSAGIDPLAYQYAVAKGVHSPRPAWESVASDMIPVASPGITTIDLETLPYRHRRRPLFPFEADTPYDATIESIVEIP